MPQQWHLPTMNERLSRSTSLDRTRFTKLATSAIPTWRWSPVGFLERRWSLVYTGSLKMLVPTVGRNGGSHSKKNNRADLLTSKKEVGQEKVFIQINIRGTPERPCPFWRRDFPFMLILPGNIPANPPRGMSLSWSQIQSSWQARPTYKA